MEACVDISAEGLEREAIYKLMSGAIAPRPVAWITTKARNGVVNAAPFSSYTIISQVPPLILFQANSAGGEKDTIVNIRATSEFVVNVVTLPQLEKAHACSARLPPEASEPEAFGIALTDSVTVTPPRVAGCPVALECRSYQLFDIGEEPHTVVIGRITSFHVADDVYTSGRIDQRKLMAVARIGGPYYAVMKELIHMPAPPEH